MASDWQFKFGNSITDLFLSDICFSPSLRIMLVEDVVGRTLMRTDI